MATGEFVSVSSQNELVAAEVRKEAHELKYNPDSEREELAGVFRMRGVDPELAEEVARQLSAQPDRGLGLHVREELGVDPEELPSPYTAAGASLVTFAVGALIPLIPYLAGLNSLRLALGLAALAAFVGGGVVARLTDRPVLPRRLPPAAPGRRSRRTHLPDRPRRRHPHLTGPHHRPDHASPGPDLPPLPLR